MKVTGSLTKLNMQLHTKRAIHRQLHKSTTASNEFDNHNTMYTAKADSCTASKRVRVFRLERVSRSPVGGSCGDWTSCEKTSCCCRSVAVAIESVYCSASACTCSSDFSSVRAKFCFWTRDSGTRYLWPVLLWWRFATRATSRSFRASNPVNSYKWTLLLRIYTKLLSDQSTLWIRQANTKKCQLDLWLWRRPGLLDPTGRLFLCTCMHCPCWGLPCPSGSRISSRVAPLAVSWTVWQTVAVSFWSRASSKETRTHTVFLPSWCRFISFQFFWFLWILFLSFAWFVWLIRARVTQRLHSTSLNFTFSLSSLSWQMFTRHFYTFCWAGNTLSSTASHIRHFLDSVQSDRRSVHGLRVTTDWRHIASLNVNIICTCTYTYTWINNQLRMSRSRSSVLHNSACGYSHCFVSDVILRFTFDVVRVLQWASTLALWAVCTTFSRISTTWEIRSVLWNV